MRSKVIPKYETLDASPSLMDKYEVTGEGWLKLVATRSFGTVNEGDTGGLIRNTMLSQSGTCWVEAGCICDNCIILDNAQVKNKSSITNVTLKANSKIDKSIIEALDDRCKITLSGNASINNCNRISVMHKLSMDGEAYIGSIPYTRIDYLSISGDTQIGNR